MVTSLIDSYISKKLRNPPPSVLETAKCFGFTGTPRNLFRQIVLMDAAVCAGIHNGVSLNALTRKQSSILNQSCFWSDPSKSELFIPEFLRIYREYAHRLLQGKSTNRIRTTYRGAVQTYLLFFMVDGIPSSLWLQRIDALFSQLSPLWMQSVRDEILQEYILLYQDAPEVLFPEDLVQLRACRDDILHVAQRMLDSVMSIAQREMATVSSAPPQSTHWRFPLSSTEDRLRFLYFLESCCFTQTETGASWRDCVQQIWSSFYPLVPFSPEIESELQHVLRRCRLPGVLGTYYAAVDKVFRHGLDDLNSGSYLYALLLVRSACMAAAYAPQDMDGRIFYRDSDELLGDTLNYRKRVSAPYALPETEEEDQLVELLTLYQKDGHYDSSLLAMAASMRQVLLKNFRALEQRVCKFNESNVLLSQMRAQLHDMEDAVQLADFNVKSKLVHQMDRGSFGCRLGQLYRFSQGLDNRDTEQIREMLRSFFALLDVMGIHPVYNERLNERISPDDALFDKMISYLDLQTEGSRILQYPGWSVNNIQTEPPIYISKKEDG